MSKNTRYEMAAAYVSVLPSLEGLAKELERQISAATPKLRRDLNSAFSQGASGAVGSIGRVLNGASSVFTSGGKAFGSLLLNGVNSAGSAFNESLRVAARTATSALAIGVGAISTQVIAGGLTRALGINEAESKLKSLGYVGEEFNQIMLNAGNAVDGTAYTLADSVGAAGQLLASGVKPGKELQGVLANIGKLTDLSSNRSYGDITAMFAKNAAAGIVQMVDLNQLIDAGVAILPALQKQFGKTGVEVKKMASAGLISFNDFNEAIEGIDFDSALYASMNVKSAFNNVRAQLSKIGANLWDPIIRGLAPALGRVRELLQILQKSPAFAGFVNKVQTQLASAMATVNAFFDNLVALFKSSEFVDGWVKKIIDSFKGFREAIKGVEGPLAGLGLALGSSFLSQLPLIGSFFSKISVGAGLMGGMFFQLFKDSDLLRGALSTLVDTVKTVFSSFSIGGGDGFKVVGDSIAEVVTGLTSVIAGIDLSNLGSLDFSGFFAGIFDGLSDLISGLVMNADRIKDAVGSVFSSVGGALEGVAGDSNLSVGEWLAETIVKGVELAANVLSIVAPLLVGAVSALGKVVTSDFGQGLLAGLVGFAGYIAKHEGLLVALGVALTGLFIGGKLSKPLIGAVNFLKGFKAPALNGGNGPVGLIDGITGFLKSLMGNFASIVKSAGKVLVTVFKTLGKIFASMVTALASVGTAVMQGAAPLAALGVFILAIGGLTWLLDKMNFFDILGGVLNDVVGLIAFVLEKVLEVAGQAVGVIGQAWEMLSSAFSGVWQVLEPVLAFARDSFITVFAEISALFLAAIDTVGQNVALFISTASEGLSTVISSVQGLLGDLALNGVAAGDGAFASAAGITALAGSLGLLTSGGLLDDVLGGLGSLWTSLVDGLTGKDSSGISELVALSDAMKTFDGGVSTLPEKWLALGSSAMSSGQVLMQNFGQGMVSGLQVAEAVVGAALLAMIARLQSQVNAVPIQLRVNQPSIGGRSGNTYNSTTNFDVSVNNPSVLASLARSAR